METKEQKRNMQQVIGKALRVGVTVACVVALVSGVYYIIRHGGEPIPDYTSFDKEAVPESYTTLTGIFRGIGAFQATEWIQFGVLLLILTPVVRILLSLAEYVGERDWLYAGITLAVFLIILFNSIGGVG